MTATSLIDDQLVLRVVLGQSPPTDLVLATTYPWWWRLGSAVRRAKGSVLSGLTLGMSELGRAALIDTIDALPALIEVPDPRDLYPVAADLAAHHGLNLLAAEALAAALVLDAEIVVSTENPGLRRAADEREVLMRLA